MKQLMSVVISLSLGFVVFGCGQQASERSSSTSAVSTFTVQTLEQALGQDQQLFFIPPPNPDVDLYAEIDTMDGVLGVEVAFDDPSQGEGLTMALWRPQTVAEFIAIDRANQLFGVPHPLAPTYLRDVSQRPICSTRKLVVDTMLQAPNGQWLAARLGIGLGLPGGGGCALRYADCVEKPCDVLGLKGNCAQGTNPIFGFRSCSCVVVAIEW